MAISANAPHVPVHLGSMSESVKSIIEGQEDMKAGDVYDQCALQRWHIFLMLL